MIKKCFGCGAIMQIEDEEKVGFVDKAIYDDALFCKRCFKIKNYGEYKTVDEKVIKPDETFEDIKEKNNLVLYLCDVFSLNENVQKINMFHGNAILVITKTDLLPKSVKESKLRKYIISNYNIKTYDVLFVNAIKNYNIDMLIKVVKKYAKQKDVYVAGYANAGKSTLINQIIKNYAPENSLVTTSIMPSTTVKTISVKIDDNLNIIDTPGLVDNDNFTSLCDVKTLKLISPKSRIRPKTYQIKNGEALIIGNYARIDYDSLEKNSFTLYISNNVQVKKVSLKNMTLKNLPKITLDVNNHEDVVFNGLCFVKIVNKCKLTIYTNYNNIIFKRKNLI